MYTNEDYDRLAVLDYRRVRYLKKSRCKNIEINFLGDGDGSDADSVIEDEESNKRSLSRSSQSDSGSELAFPNKL